MEKKHLFQTFTSSQRDWITYHLSILGNTFELE